MSSERKHQFNGLYFIFAVMTIVLFQEWWTKNSETDFIPYSQFEQQLEQGLINSVGIDEQRISGVYKNPTGEGKTHFVTTRVEPEFAQQLSRHDIEYQGVIKNTFFSDLLSWIFPILFVFGLWLFVFRRLIDRQGMGGFMTVGKSKAKVYMERATNVSFDDVAGVDEAKTELQELVDFLKNPKDYGRLGAHIPKGVLLVGPPGTGKTLLARALAGEAGVPFFSISGSEFVEMFVGVGAARVRDLFDQARKTAPAIIFIDELDALGRARSAMSPGGHDEREQTLHQLLTEVDGFDPSHGLVLLAATNRPEILDPALLRAGRFDRQVLVDRPDKIGRCQILEVHFRGKTLSPDVKAEQVAALTTGFTGADLANLVNEAALLATRRGGKMVTMEDFNLAVERIVTGLEKKNRLLNQHEREVVAHHEMGHTLVALSLKGSDPVHKVSIIPRGVGALGYTIQRPTEDRFLMSTKELTDKISVLLGGRAAEELVFEEISTGAADDIAKATDIARSMVSRYGMNTELGYVAYDNDRPNFLETIHPASRSHDYSEETAREIDLAVRQIIQQSLETSRQILRKNRAVLDLCARELLKQETLDELKLKELTSDLQTV